MLDILAESALRLAEARRKEDAADPPDKDELTIIPLRLDGAPSAEEQVRLDQQALSGSRSRLEAMGFAIGRALAERYLASTRRSLKLSKIPSQAYQRPAYIREKFDGSRNRYNTGA